ncbi:MAG: glycogen/starch/alpha-glucan family phosphorylase [Eubacteriales bacterium]
MNELRQEQPVRERDEQSGQGRGEGPMSAEKLRQSIETKLHSRGITHPEQAGNEQLYQATVQVLKDLMKEQRDEFKKRVAAKGARLVCYLCMEFLVGRFLYNTTQNMGLYPALCEVLAGYGKTFEDVYACETDPGLGNGGLGRLAACFMDSLSAGDYYANGYSLCYEQGLFKQRLVEGEQVELPDEWMNEGGGQWLFARPERTMTVRFGGQVSEAWVNGELRITHTDYEEVRAVPYDLMMVGTGSRAVNTIRLWRAKEPYNQPGGFPSQGSYIKALRESDNAELITRQLYPPDEHDEGKLLRLTQQYFLVSASLQSIFRDYFSAHGSLEGFADKLVIHINDTHPALCIPELMRILMDVYSYTWDNAWQIVTACTSYTNHTVLPEALECWRVDLFRMKLPRIFMIMAEINRRFCVELWRLYPGDWERISRMSVVAYGQVRMANLSVIAAHTVNGVSALHSEILKKTVFRDFYKMAPQKFTNVTNGVVHRRWLTYANPGLSDLIASCIGEGYIDRPSELGELEKFAQNRSVLSEMEAIKLANKQAFAAYVKEKTGRVIDPHSIFDVQVKRLHEYKRQLLNVLKILSLYTDLCENPHLEVPPQTFIFGAKAAPNYQMAKRIIKLIYFLSRELESNPLTRETLSVLFLEDYNVSVAERLIPAAELSEQISLAGKEASGTGNMKLMMNGALTIGTLDGANVEILEAVGEQNIYIFGMNHREVEELWRGGYEAREFYHRSERLHKTIDRLEKPIGGQLFQGMIDYLINGGHTVADPYMCIADFDAYCFEYQKALFDYRDRADWNRRALLNLARSGRFAADVSIERYAKEIWHVTPVGR